VFFAFVIDAFSRKVVGWQLASHMRATLVLDALRTALWQRGPGADVALVHHSDRGSQPGLNRPSQHCLRGLNVRVAGDGLRRRCGGGGLGRRACPRRLARRAGRSGDSRVRGACDPPSRGALTWRCWP
jgi:transposase InsO family protein